MLVGPGGGYGVGGGGGVDGVDTRGRHDAVLLAVADHRTASAELEDHVFGAGGFGEPAGGPVGPVVVGSGDAGQGLGLRFVGRQDGQVPEALEGDGLWRARIENHRDAALLAATDRVADRLERDLELQEQRVDVLHPGGLAGVVERRIDVLRGDRVVGAADEDDPVLAVGLDDDRRRAGRAIRVDAEPGGVDAVLVESGCELRAPGVVAHTSDEPGAAAEACHGDRLVGALAAWDEPQVVTDDGLAAARRASGADDDVHVDAADDKDTGLSAHGGEDGTVSCRASGNYFPEPLLTKLCSAAPAGVIVDASSTVIRELFQGQCLVRAGFSESSAQSSAATQVR